MNKPEDFIHMPIPASMFTAVCALLGGASAIAIAAAPAPAANPPKAIDPAASGDTKEKVADPVAEAAPAGDGAEVDAGGWPWSADMHAGSKGKTKDGFWRMKVGVSRPDPKPGFEVAAGNGDTGTANSGAASQAPVSASEAPVSSTDEDDDEFAAFRAASEKAGASAPAEVPARKWTDADLSKLCNQAAQKLNNPAPVKEVIAEFTKDVEGSTGHSRDIPEANREAFAQAIEAKAGIKFEG